MTDPENIILHHLQAIREEQKALREELALNTAKIGALAEGQVGIRRDLQGAATQIHGLRADFQTLAIAFDGHSQRLDRMEERLDRIEQRLGLTEFNSLKVNPAI